MGGLQSILFLFHNKFNKFNNTSSQMLKLVKNALKAHFCCKNIIILSFCHYVLNVVMDITRFPENL